MSLGKPQQSADLTGPQADIACILAVLYQGGLGGRKGMSLPALCKRLDMRLSTLQRYLTGMEEEGWVTVTGDQTVSRQACLTLLGERMCQEWWGAGDPFQEGGAVAPRGSFGPAPSDAPPADPQDDDPLPGPTGYTPYGRPPGR